jgi:pyrroloquinoline-quinone synthase
MRDVYRLPPSGVGYFSQHASATGTGAVSEIEDEHASAARRLLARYCDTEERRRAAHTALARAVELRHQHFDAIVREGEGPSEAPFRWRGPDHG